MSTIIINSKVFGEIFVLNIRIIYIRIFVPENYANSSSSNFRQLKMTPLVPLFSRVICRPLSFISSLHSHVVPWYFKRAQHTWKHTQIKRHSYRTRYATSTKLRWRLRERRRFQGYVKDTLIYICEIAWIWIIRRTIASLSSKWNAERLDKNNKRGYYSVIVKKNWSAFINQ